MLRIVIKKITIKMLFYEKSQSGYKIFLTTRKQFLWKYTYQQFCGTQFRLWIPVPDCDLKNHNPDQDISKIIMRIGSRGPKNHYLQSTILICNTVAKHILDLYHIALSYERPFKIVSSHISRAQKHTKYWQF